MALLVTISFSVASTEVGIDCSTVSFFVVFQVVLPRRADSELVGLLTDGLLVFWFGSACIDFDLMVFALFRCVAFLEDSGLIELILPLLLDRLNFNPLSFLLRIIGLVVFALAKTWYLYKMVTQNMLRKYEGK